MTLPDRAFPSSGGLPALISTPAMQKRRKIHIDDPQSTLLTKLATMEGNHPDALLRHEIFAELRSIPSFTERLGDMIADIDEHGVIPTLRRALRDDARELVS